MMINISKHSYVRAIVRTDIKSTNKYGGINGVPHVYPVSLTVIALIVMNLFELPIPVFRRVAMTIGCTLAVIFCFLTSKKVEKNYLTFYPKNVHFCVLR